MTEQSISNDDHDGDEKSSSTSSSSSSRSSSVFRSHRHGVQNRVVWIFYPLIGVAVCVVYILGKHTRSFLGDSLDVRKRPGYDSSSTRNNTTTIFTATLTATTPTSTFRSVLDLNWSRYQEVHSSDVEILELLDWERSSLLNLKKSSSSPALCNPPDGVPTTCCVGSYSTGGQVYQQSQPDRARCMGVVDQWEDLEDAVHAQYYRSQLQNNIPRRPRPRPRPQQLRHSDNRNNIDSNMIPCDICQLVEHLRSHNFTLTMIGDSMHAQVWEGLVCELARRNYLIPRESVSYLGMKNRSLYHDVMYTDTLSVRSPVWSNNTPPVSMKFHRLYRVPVQNQSHLAEILEETDVLVMGFGLHWHHSALGNPTILQKDTYTNVMSDFLTQVQQYNVSVVVHRETSAQHFDSPGGAYELYDDRDNSNSSLRCVVNNEHIRPHSSLYWRERAVEVASQHAGFQYHVVDGRTRGSIRRQRKNRRRLGGSSSNDAVILNSTLPSSSNRTEEEEETHTVRPRLFVLPYHNFTHRFHRMHPTNREPDKLQDCTHYCGSPFLYMPLWRPLRLILDGYLSS